MMRLQVVMLGLVVAAAARGATFPVSARLTLDTKEQRCLAVEGEAPDCTVASVVRGAFDATVGGMFRRSDVPDLELVLQVRSVDISQVTGLELVLATRIVVLTPGGRRITEVDASGMSPLLEVAPAPIAIALRQAAEEAARDFERNYKDDTAVADYLIKSNVATPSEVSVRDRSDRLITLAFGMGAMHAGDDWMGATPSVRLAGAFRFLFAQADFAIFSPTFRGANAVTPVPNDIGMSTRDFGVELGGVYRISKAFELRAGPGVHFLSGDASRGGASQSYSKAVPAIYAAATGSFVLFRKSPRMVVGLEARGYFFSSVELPTFSRGVPSANASLALTLGMEFPWGSAKELR